MQEIRIKRDNQLSIDNFIEDPKLNFVQRKCASDHKKSCRYRFLVLYINIEILYSNELKQAEPKQGP